MTARPTLKASNVHMPVATLMSWSLYPASLVLLTTTYQNSYITSALRNVIESARVACDDTESVAWTRGWEKGLERHVLRSVRASSAQAAPMKTLVTDAFAQGSKLLDAGQNSQGVFKYISRALYRGLGGPLRPP